MAALTLAHPTEAEQRAVWALNHDAWGGGLSRAAYEAREAALATAPLARRGGLTYWILTTAGDGAGDGARPVLASCETLRKRVLVARPGDGGVREGVGFGIASVFTAPAARGRGYASRLLAELGGALRRGDGDDDDDVVCSALWSDVGRAFYGRLGWAPFPSAHLAFAAAAAEPPEPPAAEEARPLGCGDLAELCRVDEALLRTRLARRGPDDDDATTTRLAFLPDLDQLLWHLRREDLTAAAVFGSGAAEPGARGAVAGAEGARVWAVWARAYGGAADQPRRNVLHVLRLVVEDETAPAADLARRLDAVLRVARREAAAWACAAVHLWNPDALVRALVDRCGRVPGGICAEDVQRYRDSIPSLMMYGLEDGGRVEWVANEKYCWC